MSLYYSDEFVTLYHGDCMDNLAWLDADVLVTDPPYGIAWSKGGGLKNSRGQGNPRPMTGIANDGDTAARDKALEAWGDRPGIVFGDLLRPVPARTRQALIYRKPADAGIRATTAGHRRDVEGIYLVGPWDHGIGGKSAVLTTNANVIAGLSGPAARYGHSHSKPIDLMEYLVGLAPGVIADPFAGSGSTLVAARNLGRRAIGVELEEKYCEIIASRLSQGALDLTGVMP